MTLAVLPDAALQRLVDLAEREPLLADLAAYRPAPGSEPVLERLRALLAANESLAARQRAEIRAQMSHIGSGRRAINAYAPGGGGDTARSMAWLDREG